ncbi:MULTISPECIES: PAS domain-containing protein [unclassified Sphingobium]|uniref:PAS domain-containing protein n=1 Tax=unclassified Sphingobium TaxID=2611147 RepID=UPI0022253EE1|nr:MULTISPECIES: PAS domain-containing protein [unclassified Sphingobium]MCW2380711.1 PAS domain S-box-containing protein [Sphingobium sp. B2D3B]MCW2399181.1 PAS domain S-box-containing protein [Sphingobium sp. B2D3C]
MASAESNRDAVSPEERITLEAYEIDGLFGDEELTRIVEFAGQLCDCPIALVSLVEEHRQRFVAKTGIDATETPRSMSFCAHAMLGHDVMDVGDATQDARFQDNPLVTGEPHIRFYAGAPLVSKSGEALGSLCVISPEPRTGLTDIQRQGLTVLAEATMRRLEARRVMLAHRAWENAAEADLAASEERFRVLADAMPQMVWSTRADGYHDYYNARWYEFTGAQLGRTDGTGWNGQFHPDDQAKAWEVWSHSLATGDPYEIEYRLRRFDGEYRWTLGRALPIRDDAGNIVRWFGTCTDIHDQRIMREQKELLSRELVHRIKNIFTVIGSLLYLSSRGVPELKGFSSKMSDQIAALGRAYDYVQPREGAQTLTLQGLLGELFAAYNLEGIERIRIRGDDVLLAETYMTPIALVFHELATNAVKYGSLSSPEGFVDLMISGSSEQLRLEWQESKGDSAPPGDHQGFGSDLIRLSIERQLRGTFVREWLPRGLKVTTTIPYRLQAA